MKSPPELPRRPALESQRLRETELDELVPESYDDLRRLASHILERRWRPDGPRATSLVHETYARLARSSGLRIRGREHLLALAAHAMRLILVDQVRRRTSLKAGGGAVPLSLDVLPLDPAVGESDLLAINDAIEALAKLDLRKVRVVELRFFGGLSVEETALALGVSTPTIKRDWALARSWLRREMARA